MNAALLTSDTPRWLVLLMVAVVAAAYVACAVLSLIGRARDARQGGVRTRARTRVRQEITS